MRLKKAIFYDQNEFPSRAELNAWLFDNCGEDPSEWVFQTPGTALPGTRFSHVIVVKPHYDTELLRESYDQWYNDQLRARMALNCVDNIFVTNKEEIHSTEFYLPEIQTEGADMKELKVLFFDPDEHTEDQVRVWIKENAFQDPSEWRFYTIGSQFKGSRISQAIIIQPSYWNAAESRSYRHWRFETLPLQMVNVNREHIYEVQHGDLMKSNLIIEEAEAEQAPVESDMVSSPSHYTGGLAKILGIEVIDIANALNLNGNRFSILRYVLRAGKKFKDKEIEDLEKIKMYAEFEIRRLKGLPVSDTFQSRELQRKV